MTVCVRGFLKILIKGHKAKLGADSTTLVTTCSTQCPPAPRPGTDPRSSVAGHPCPATASSRQTPRAPQTPRHPSPCRVPTPARGAALLSLVFAHQHPNFRTLCRERASSLHGSDGSGVLKLQMAREAAPWAPVHAGACEHVRWSLPVCEPRTPNSLSPRSLQAPARRPKPSGNTAAAPCTDHNQGSSACWLALPHPTQASLLRCGQRQVFLRPEPSPGNFTAPIHARCRPAALPSARKHSWVRCLRHAPVVDLPQTRYGQDLTSSPPKSFSPYAPIQGSGPPRPVALGRMHPRVLLSVMNAQK